MKKINIAELLKDCPRGMELYSPIFGKVYLDKIRSHLAIVVTSGKKRGAFVWEFLYDGRYGMNGECMLFPSKGKTTWEGFVSPCEFKVGDKVVFDDAKEKPLTIRKMWRDRQAKEILCSFEEDDIDVPVKDLDRYIKPKFDITTLQPFESRVLVRDYDMRIWLPHFFGCLYNSNDSPYMAVGGTLWRCCIPYEGNEHLLGKTEDCDDFYKTWE